MNKMLGNLKRWKFNLWVISILIVLIQVYIGTKIVGDEIQRITEAKMQTIDRNMNAVLQMGSVLSAISGDDNYQNLSKDVRDLFIKQIEYSLISVKNI